MKLTYAMLKAKHPCRDQLKIYMENFPDNLEIKKSDLLKAAELGLDFYWFAENFLPKMEQAAYDKARATALAAYDKATAPVLWDILSKT